VALAIAGGSVAVTSGGAVSGGASTAGRVAAREVSSNVAKGKRSARTGKRRTTWDRLGLKRLKEDAKHAVVCAVESYGQVQQFFLRTPCRSLDRILIALADGPQDAFVVSVSWVRMRSATSARSLRDLADVDGTGNVSPLPGELIGVGPIRWTGMNYASRRSGTLVVIAEVEPLRGTPDPKWMDGVADIAAEFPPP
jgi:hypothetical protein